MGQFLTRILCSVKEYGITVQILPHFTYFAKAGQGVPQKPRVKLRYTPCLNFGRFLYRRVTVLDTYYSAVVVGGWSVRRTHLWKVCLPFYFHAVGARRYRFRCTLMFLVPGSGALDGKSEYVIGWQSFSSRTRIVFVQFRSESENQF